MRCGKWLVLLSALALISSSPVEAAGLPQSANAPAVGAKAPDFTLPDANGDSLTLSQLYTPRGSGKGSWVLLVFYRGYW